MNIDKLFSDTEYLEKEIHFFILKKQIKNTSPEVRRVIEREFEHENFDYIRKLGIIRENIYGADILFFWKCLEAEFAVQSDLFLLWGIVRDA